MSRLSRSDAALLESTTFWLVGAALLTFLATLLGFIAFMVNEVQASSLAGSSSSSSALASQLSANGLEVYSTICNWTVSIPEGLPLYNGDEGVLIGETFHLDSIGSVRPIWLVSYDAAATLSEGLITSYTGNASSCNGPILADTYLRQTRDFGVDPSNFRGLSSGFINSRIDRAVDEWDCETSADVFGSRSASIVVDGFDSGSPDGKNEIMFGNANDPAIIAVTIVWIDTGANNIIEWDMLFNEASHTFGDAVVNGAIMDFESIAVHELGHSLGLKDITAGSCNQVTMYAFSSVGEFHKRSIEAADVAGLVDLYGSPSSGDCSNTEAPTASDASPSPLLSSLGVTSAMLLLATCQ